MPATLTDKGLAQGWNLGEGNWKPGMDENMLRITAMIRASWAQDRSTTVGLLYGYFGGMLLIDDVWTRIAGGTIALNNDDLNYVEFDPTTGVVSVVSDEFSADRCPMAVVSVIAGEITGVVDSRSEIASVAALLAQIQELALQAPVHGDGAPVDGVTGVNNASKQYINDDPAAGEAILYLNVGTLANPQWSGVMTV